MIQTIQLPNHTYDVVIDDEAYQLLTTTYLPLLSKADHVGIIADEHAAELHLTTLTDPLKKVGIEPKIKIVPSGERCKSPDIYIECQSFFLQQQFTRQSLLIAFGGGACGDLTGFVAATYMRGIPFIQCPTTILAHDSAVGGKTAINLPEGKNMVGAFHQPIAVFFQPDVFETLPPREIRSGLAEVLKHAFISDLGWTEALLKEPQFTTPSQQWLAKQLLQGIQVKANIVMEDEFEHGQRKFLNFGHTFGHGVEAACGFGQLSHGESVMIGMVYALLLSERYGSISPVWTDRLITFAYRNGYTFEPIQMYDFQTFFTFMKKDKKVTHGQMYFVLLEEIGKPFVQSVDEQSCLEVFNELKKRLRRRDHR